MSLPDAFIKYSHIPKANKSAMPTHTSDQDAACFTAIFCALLPPQAKISTINMINTNSKKVPHIHGCAMVCIIDPYSFFMLTLFKKPLFFLTRRFFTAQPTLFLRSRDH